MNKNGVIAVVVVVVAIVLVGLWAMRSGESGMSGPDCSNPPSVPQGVSYSLAKDIATISWSPAPTGERVVTYLIEAKTAKDANWTTFVAPGSATTFQRQAPPETYYVHVLARNACGTSGQSSELVVNVP